VALESIPPQEEHNANSTHQADGLTPVTSVNSSPVATPGKTQGVDRSYTVIACNSHLSPQPDKNELPLKPVDDFRSSSIDVNVVCGCDDTLTLDKVGKARSGEFGRGILLTNVVYGPAKWWRVEFEVRVTITNQNLCYFSLRV
jgi:hypothetical protein